MTIGSGITLGTPSGDVDQMEACFSLFGDSIKLHADRLGLNLTTIGLEIILGTTDGTPT
jgi:hypothetical protein